MGGIGWWYNGLENIYACLLTGEMVVVVVVVVVMMMMMLGSHSVVYHHKWP